MLIEKFQTNRDYIRHQNIGIIKTPCYPAQYYCGFIFQNNNEWIPAYNETQNFHKSLEEAENKFLKLLDNLKN